MKYFIIVLLLLIPVKVFSIKNDTLINKDLNQKTLASDMIKISLPDSLKVLNIDRTQQDPGLSSNMPWIVALIIGLLSFALNLIITNKVNKTASFNLSQQIISAKGLALTNFKAKLKTENMQKWLDDLREDLSEYLSYCAQARAKLAGSENDINEEFKKMVKFKVKLLTKLNLKHTEERVVAEKINELFKRGFTPIKDFTATQHIELENALLVDMRTLVELHWSKIKNIEE